MSVYCTYIRYQQYILSSLFLIQFPLRHHPANAMCHPFPQVSKKHFNLKYACVYVLTLFTVLVLPFKQQHGNHNCCICERRLLIALFLCL